MKTLRALCVAALTATAVFAADAPPAFNATLTTGKESRFVLVDSTGKASSWLSLGDSFAGYTLKNYDAKTSTLELEKDGQLTKVGIAADAAMGIGGDTGAKASLAEASALLEAMNFEKLLDQTLTGVRKQQQNAIGQMMGRMVPPGAERDEVIAFQQRILETMMSGLSAAEMKDDVAKAYTEVFSKEELRALGGFFSSPIGQVYSDKTPQLTQKMNEVIMPRMMANMPKVQQMAQEFGQKMQAKRAEAKAAADAAAATPAAATPGAASPGAPAATPAPKP